MFSATLRDPKIKEIAEQICKFPAWIDLKGAITIPQNVDHGVIFADPTQDPSWENAPALIKTDGVHARDRFSPKLDNPESLSEATKRLKAQICKRLIDTHKMEQALIFVRTKLDADNLEQFFNQLGGGKAGEFMQGDYPCAAIHGDRSAQERRQNFEDFKSGEVRFLICTDVAARGLDISGLPYVINFTLPDKPAQYIHRIGRTGRADKIGLAISIVATNKEKVWYHTCPSRGKNCNNTKLTTDKPGGCCIWYDEPTLLQQIEQLAGPVPRLTPAGNMPSGATKKYGEAAAGGDSEVWKGHEQFLKPIVTELSELEKSIQSKFHLMRTMWSTGKK
eukprot:TRINITY_DN2432_c0_g1_i1.p1 TRINITY_DN2432_c0_g1~~TRINITY_DN2432_c0_g1_i1.p1  ORF type:complete len:335 (+),score=51.01 TRINITY_DN2432_c0_g1_i1:105-1109(+)